MAEGRTAPQILVVSPDSEAARRLQAAATAVGYAVVHSYEPTDGPPACMVVDTTVDGGLEQLAQLHTSDPTVPLVALVNADADAVHVRNVQSGVRDYLVKGRIDEIRVAEVLSHVFAPTPPDVDALTGLPGRSVFFDRVSQAMRRLGRHESLLGVLVLDVQSFRLLNATYGTEEGDRILIEMSRRLESVLRPSDTVTRLGSDQFALLCDDLADVHAARAVAQRVHDVLAEPFELAGQRVHVTTGLGVAVTGDPNVGIGVLVREAQEARRLSKQRGGTIQLANSALVARGEERAAVERALVHALDAGEFRLFYQPVYTLPGRQPVAVEALLRWAHPERGLLEAGEFVESAESTGVIVPIGNWVLAQAAEAAVRWQLPVSVNVSGRELRQPRFADQVADVLARAGCPSEHIRLEVGERVVADDLDLVVQTAWALRAIGVELSVDNVGAGGASIAALRHVPARALEVDRSVVDDRELCAAVVGVAHALGMVAALEGVEAADQVATAELLGFDLAQGWFLGPPGDAQGVPARLGLI
jgi:diguanylate cyclase (GGDEF)-like protein